MHCDTDCECPKQQLNSPLRFSLCVTPPHVLPGELWLPWPPWPASPLSPAPRVAGASGQQAGAALVLTLFPLRVTLLGCLMPSV